MNRTRNTRHGPVWLPDSVQFRLWAPSVNSVDLLVGDRSVSMEQEEEGWYEATERHAEAGDRYLFRIDGDLKIPDPASRFQPEGIDGPSELVTPDNYIWADNKWHPLPWEEVVIYELHVGTFAPSGKYSDIEGKLGYLASLGVTAIELMPLATFAGRRGWGYDGVLPYAPHPAYGRPEDLKKLINSAHEAGLMVFLDVVYNHFGPSGNFLPAYAKSFFTEKYKTPWGSAINMEGPAAVRDFFIDNALYWLDEYHLDGLRLDAVHAIFDQSVKHILIELAETVRHEHPGKHLILENDKNEARYLEYDKSRQPKYYTAQWNDDIHHCFHVLLTGETDSYYEDYGNRSLKQLGRCLTQGFAYQGEISPHRHGAPRGEKSDHLPPQAFISFLQNHDQIGNRAMGERLAVLAPKEKLILATSILLLAPQPPLLFMGEEWGARTPLLYFCDFEGKLAEAVREGRRNEFRGFPAFTDPERRERIPDPNEEGTFLSSCLNWKQKDETDSMARLAFTKRMLELRRQYTIPLVKSGWIESHFHIEDDRGLDVRWTFAAGTLRLFANFSGHEIENGAPSHLTHIWGHSGSPLPAWKSGWFLEGGHG